MIIQTFFNILFSIIIIFIFSSRFDIHRSPTPQPSSLGRSCSSAPASTTASITAAAAFACSKPRCSCPSTSASSCSWRRPGRWLHPPAGQAFLDRVLPQNLKISRFFLTQPGPERPGAGLPGPGCVFFSHYPIGKTFSTDIHMHIQLSPD